MTDSKVLKTPKTIILPFPATLENVDRTTRKIEQFLSHAGIKDPSQSFDIVLGMREALNNAVTHGSKKDLKKTVCLTLRMKGDVLIMEVEDEGDGFDWKRCMEKGLPFKEESGRGLAIMKRFFTSMRYNRKGNKLIMEKRI
ncbi:MAG: ATP-binding protein [Deltaproteobacteria bacterium]|nr:ATP-binding protein [Deltaproteobacteria bacterium]